MGENLLQRCRIWLSKIPEEIFTPRTCWPCYLWLLSNKWRKVRENQRQRSKKFKKSQKVIIHVKLKNIFTSKNFFSRKHRGFHDEQIPSWKSNHNIIVLRGGTLYCCTIFKGYYRQTKHCTVLTGLHERTEGGLLRQHWKINSILVLPWAYWAVVSVPENTVPLPRLFIALYQQSTSQIDLVFYRSLAFMTGQMPRAHKFGTQESRNCNKHDQNRNPVKWVLTIS